MIDQNKLAIETAFNKVVTELTAAKEQFLSECDTEQYDDITIDDAYIWFIESF